MANRPFNFDHTLSLQKVEKFDQQSGSKESSE